MKQGWQHMENHSYSGTTSVWKWFIIKGDKYTEKKGKCVHLMVGEGREQKRDRKE